MKGSNNSLSNLPDVVIQKIICLLPTEDAIPNLEFCQRPHAASARSPLVNIVDRALLLRGPADIKLFNLRFPVLSDACRVNAWISAILRRNVEKLYIYLHSIKGTFSLPHSLFTSASLIVLDLDIPLLFKAPSTVCLSSLRNLGPRSVVFSDDSMQQLFSGCPILEELSLEECIWVNLKFVNICAPKLLKLTIINESDSQLSRGSDGCQFMIFAASLTYFSYSGKHLNDYWFYNSSSCNEAHIYLSSNAMNSRHIACRLYKLLRGLSSVEDLTVSYYAFEVLVNNAPELLAQMPLFNDLTTLVLEDPVHIDGKALLAMLQCCPCLQTLVLVEGIGLSSDRAADDGCWSHCLHVSRHILKKLKLVNLVEMRMSLMH